MGGRPNLICYVDKLEAEDQLVPLGVGIDYSKTWELQLILRPFQRLGTEMKSLRCRISRNKIQLPPLCGFIWFWFFRPKRPKQHTNLRHRPGSRRLDAGIKAKKSLPSRCSMPRCRHQPKKGPPASMLDASMPASKQKRAFRVDARRLDAGIKAKTGLPRRCSTPRCRRPCTAHGWQVE